MSNETTELLNRLSILTKRKTGNQKLAKVSIEDVCRTIDLIGALAETIGEKESAVRALRNGNSKLLEALMGMVEQYFYRRNDSGKSDEDGEFLVHSFMSSDEHAIAVLLEAGFADEVEGVGYRLLNDKLDARIEQDKNEAPAVITNQGLDTSTGRRKWRELCEQGARLAGHRFIMPDDTVGFVDGFGRVTWGKEAKT